MYKACIAALFFLAATYTYAEVAVVASFSILADLTRQIGGPRVSVTSLVGPNQDIHLFEPSVADIKPLRSAQLFIINGFGIEGWLQRLTHLADFRGELVVAADHMALLKDKAGRIDPHAWHDPQRVVTYVRNIEQALSRVDPAGQKDYARRARHFIQDIEALDRWARAQFAPIDEKKRIVLTSHDAFAYLAARYQLRFLAPQGFNAQTESSAQTVASLVRLVRQYKIRAIFFENGSHRRLLQQIAQEAGIPVGQKLYADALSLPGGPADTWLHLMRYNVSTIARALYAVK